ncbi:MAG: 50S ribosomal protein L6 [Kiritimatiellia bacterium]|nr:50S ribosomal protein L6 [Kiritimatiellia bacterium]
MSRIGVQPIVLPAGVSVRLEQGVAKVQGPKGELVYALPGGISLNIEDNRVNVSREANRPELTALHGTARSLLTNMVRGVHEGYVRELEIQGVGYRAQIAGKALVLNIGFSHPIEFPIPEGLAMEVADGVRITIRGVDKQQVGEAAARIRSYYKAEPYKGKGIRYKDERVRRKAGKTVT